MYTRWMLRVFVWSLLASGTVCGASDPVRVGVYEMPPHMFTDYDGSIVGFFPEVLEQIAVNQGWSLEYVHGTRAECFDMLARGEVDLSVDTEGADGLYPSDTVFINWDTAFSRSGLTIQSIADLENRNIVVVQDGGKTSIADLLRAESISCTVTTVEDCREVFLLLDAQGADVGFVNHLYGVLHCNEYDVNVSSIVLDPRSCRFVAHPGSVRGCGLIDQVADVLRSMKNDSESVYNRALAFYLGGGNGRWPSEDRLLDDSFQLTAEEQAWVREHPVIRFGVDPEFMPYEVVGADGVYEGIAADWLRLISRRTGLEFSLEIDDDWSESVAALEHKQLDLLPCIGMGEDRHRFMLFSQPYLHFSRVLVTRTDRDDIMSLQDLLGQRVAVQSNSSHHEYLKAYADVLEIVLYPTYQETLLAVSRGDADAAVGNLAVTTHCLRNLMLTNLKMAAYAMPTSNPLCMGVRDDWPQLISIINRAIDSVDPQTREAVYAKWLPLHKPADPSVHLTPEERDWLLLHPRVRVCWDRNWPPIEFADHAGTPCGISQDYLDKLGDMLGIEFVPLPATSWQEAYEKLRNQEADLASCLSPTENRLQFLDFTDCYFSSPTVFFAREGMGYIRGMDDLEALRTVVVADYATDDWIRKNYPRLRPVRAADIDEAFSLLYRGEVDVFIESAVVGNYYLSRHQMTGIKIVGDAPYTYHLRMAVRDDWPVFSGILRKAIAALPEEDATAFYRKWVWLEYEHGADYSLLWKILAACFGVFTLFLYWNRRMAREIRNRKAAEQQLAESREQLEASYEELKRLEQMKEDLVNMVLHDMRSPLQSISGALDVLILEGEESGQEVDEFLYLANESSRSLKSMIQSLLDVSRLESNEMQLCRSRQSIREIVENAVGAFSILLMEKQSQVDVCGDSLSVIDADIMQRVFMNLISNAVKASPLNSRITISIQDEEHCCSVRIKDQGCGIPKEMHGRIFDKFARVEARVRSADGSMGLGLAFCKLAVESHGGRIWVDSMVDVGTSFFIELPKSAAPCTGPSI
ncbi:MAG: transporter substrate-binding domain-containing protein [Pontiellaceae bacterium]|nr:transporter substrate-binding domain-containing protein [Pontiellaceae bacterium]MBN2783604.1 transporter substrate-binding domain-containing protein [Pontiellaceae bacterium]